MKKNLLKLLESFGISPSIFKNLKSETQLLAMGKLLSNQQGSINSDNINDFEFKIFSQWGDDGIIQYLIKNIFIENKIFIEFGVENFLESNTRFLMMNNNWAGFVMDGSEDAMKSLQKQDWYWKYDLTQKAVFIDTENINQLLADTGFSNIGLLHIDLDGNDYHIFKELNLSALNPSIIILEYNAVFGKERAITTPYAKDFIRTNAHYSNLYFGASLAALDHLAENKGYSLVGCNLAGNNGYFVRKDLLNEKIKAKTVNTAFIESNFRESRNRDYSFSFLGGKARLETLQGLEVMNVITNEKEKL